MKWLMILFIVSPSVFAQTDPHQPMPDPANQETQNYSHEFGEKKKTKRADTISGQCIVQAGGGNLMTTPCTDLILTLVPTHKGDEISVRTDHEGMFQFTIEQGQSYRLKPGSKLFDVVSPTQPISAAINLGVQLRQK